MSFEHDLNDFRTNDELTMSKLRTSELITMEGNSMGLFYTYNKINSDKRRLT
jgi:hypothetical protein